MGRIRSWPALLALVSIAVFLSGCAAFNGRERLVQTAIRLELGGDYEALKALYTPEAQAYFDDDIKKGMGGLYRMDAAGVPKIRRLRTQTLYNADGRSVVLATFEFTGRDNAHYFVVASYNLLQHGRNWYIINYNPQKREVP